MATDVKGAIAAALRSVVEPTSGRDVHALGFVRNVSHCDGVARVVLAVPANVATPALHDHLTKQAHAAVARVPGVSSVNVEVLAVSPTAASAMPGVRHVVAVGAGKGGVGKSTVAVLLAAGLRRMGRRVGLLDADVYGPSIPKMTGTETLQPTTDEKGRLIPPRVAEMPILSMGYLVPADQAVVWRGPMAQKYVKELLDRGAWGELDELIVDLPPGTGDIPLTLAQSIPLTGAVVVCTPQDVALLDAVKALRMYEKLGVPTLGLVENMSFYVCPQCGHRAEIFDHGGCEEAAATLGVPFLGAIPIDIDIRKNGDAGRVFENFTDVDAEVSAAIERVVAGLVEQLDGSDAASSPAPTLNITG